MEAKMNKRKKTWGGAIGNVLEWYELVTYRAPIVKNIPELECRDFFGTQSCVEAE